MNYIVRQGDVLLLHGKTTHHESVELPEDAEHVECDGAVVIAWGEVTNHRHQISTDYAEMYRWKGDVLIPIVKEGGAVTHEEHLPAQMPAKVFKYVPQLEYSPQELRRVTD